MDKNNTPIITIDGPSGSGKGTIGQLIATKLHWHFLDSGSLYRCLALAAQDRQLKIQNSVELAKLALHLNVKFQPISNGSLVQIELDERIVTDAIRDEQCGKIASEIAAIPAVREALLDRQQAFLSPPGLVADGRDMGTIVFPKADLKIFLTASAEVRADRRYKQLKQKGISVNLAGLLEEIKLRDERDANRKVAPLIPAEDALIVDASNMNINKVFEYIWNIIQARQLA